MKNKKRNIIISIVVIVIIIFEVFIRLSLDRTVRYYLFKKGYYRTSFQCKIIKSDFYNDDIERYYTIDPSIGPDLIAVKKNGLGLWYIDIDKTGGA
ncbi:hypothetical protein KQI86_07075 [Clostridium sp. MSJ-11]|uniref:Uncharacterized protein n=1 Tax=Clostridium mobile TaxID=2841512 RepID=A0ABS6EH50_9CLOT|nr:hypothetical protein [Clostridium mobile]MBU5484087.1 hypothetical protein [Clostridium mobile]